MTGSLVVVNRLSNCVSIVDLAEQEVRAMIDTGPGPHEVGLSPDGRTAYVSVYGEMTPGTSLLVIDVEKGIPIGEIDLKAERRPHGIVWLDADRFLVTSEVTSSLLVLNARTSTIEQEIPTEAKGSHMVAAHAPSNRAYTTNIPEGTVSVLDLAARKLVKKIPCGVNPEGVALTPDGKELWAADRRTGRVHVIDTATLEEVASFDVGKVPFRIAASPDGATMLVSCPEDNGVAIVDRATRAVTKIGNAPGIRRLNEHSIEGGPQHPVPLAFAVTACGSYAFVSNVNSMVASVLDLKAGRMIGTIVVGRGPDGLAWTPVVCTSEL